MKAAVFDLDGTLIDSAGGIAAAANIAMAQEGLAAFDLETIRGFTGGGASVLLRRCLRARNVADIDTVFPRCHAGFMAAYRADPVADTAPYPGGREFLGQLRARGIPMAICTNKPTDLAELAVRNLGIADFFDILVGAEDGRPLKPDPAQLQAVLAHLRLDARDILYVGDTNVDAETARVTQAPFAFFSGGFGTIDPKEIPDAMIFDHFDALARAVFG